MSKHFKVVIIGGGSAGVSVAARLLRQSSSLVNKIAIIEPVDKHYYQPLWTLVGGGVAKKEVTERDMKFVIPKGVSWIQEAVITFLPIENTLVTDQQQRISYDYLVVAAGIETNWKGVKGLQEAIGHYEVCSNYSYQHVDYTWKTIRSFQGGTALFTHPATPIKCGGAPQKIMYLAEDHFKKSGVRNQTDIIFGSANATIFDVAKYRETLEKVLQRKQIDARFRKNLIEIKAEEKLAIFEHLDTGEQDVVSYNMIHVTPPMKAPAFIEKSPLSDKEGWLDVHKHTLQHIRYNNIFGLGDCANLPTSKTGAAIRKQAPVVASNIVSLMRELPLDESYDGYTSCPIVTGYNKLVLAEFDYSKTPCEMMPFNQAIERQSMYLLKKDLLPIMYWNGMLKGTM
ncbi:FAD-dependent oxidoreductase [Lysinibacillus sp. NPDC096418]|uniref:NAD(P)/FAD-dependent oxidoreductase n=1 Tax=Lysinibacillus sp. NPDC096418 TaxID=3364138 RepID=UPI00381427E9